VGSTTDGPLSAQNAECSASLFADTALNGDKSFVGFATAALMLQGARVAAFDALLKSSEALAASETFETALASATNSLKALRTALGGAMLQVASKECKFCNTCCDSSDTSLVAKILAELEGSSSIPTRVLNTRESLKGGGSLQVAAMGINGAGNTLSMMSNSVQLGPAGHVITETAFFQNPMMGQLSMAFYAPTLGAVVALLFFIIRFGMLLLLAAVPRR
jgi:hypothetical protein